VRGETGGWGRNVQIILKGTEGDPQKKVRKTSKKVARRRGENRRGKKGFTSNRKGGGAVCASDEVPLIEETSITKKN